MCDVGHACAPDLAGYLRLLKAAKRQTTRWVRAKAVGTRRGRKPVPEAPSTLKPQAGDSKRR